VSTTIRMKRGNTRKFIVTITDQVTKLPIDINGMALAFAAMYKSVEEAAVISKTVGSGIEMLPPTSNGQARITIDPDDTVGFPLKAVSLVWDIQIKAGEEPYTVEDGTLVVEPNVASVG
jgi:hypothetical protein